MQVHEFRLAVQRDYVAMDREIAAHHEAGHAVAQWCVGWIVGECRWQVDGENVTNPETKCSVDDHLTSLAAIRKRLFVLFAGQQATLKRWVGSSNDGGDWRDVLRAIDTHLGRKPKYKIDDGYHLDDSEANALVQDARSRCADFIADPAIEATIASVANLLLLTPADVDGSVVLHADPIVAACETHLGRSKRVSNSLASWLAGK